MSVDRVEIEVGAIAVTLRRATIAEIIALRDEILIRGTERVSRNFDGDDAADTVHLGAFSDGANLACVSFMMSSLDGRPAWQLRGMATAALWQGRGLGGRLLGFAESFLAARGAVDLMWCNARTGAVRFYERFGWRGIGEVFEIDGVGPHLRMSKWTGARERQ